MQAGDYGLKMKNETESVNGVVKLRTGDGKVILSP